MFNRADRPAFEVDLDRDVRAVEAMAENLTPYIYEEELFGRLDASLPRLTLGGLLMRFHRLEALRDQLTPEQQAVVRKAQQKFEEVRREWPVHYEGKLQHELRSRLVALGQYLQEAEEHPRLGLENFASSMEKRVMVEALKDAAEEQGVWTDELKGTLLSTDNRISRLIERGSFIWDSRVEAAYPPDKFWFLYASYRLTRK
jgi:hypothetical protein